MQAGRRAIALAGCGLALVAGGAPDLEQARRGDAQAQYDVAAAYFQGEAGFGQNIGLALEWLEKAVAQGHVPAGYRLGEIYFHGYGGVEKDPAKAAAAWAGPAAADYREAKVYLGFMYFMGQGVAQDESRGIQLLREASARGQTAAHRLLWEAYAGGKVQPADATELSQWLEAGVAAGDVRARESLGVRLMLGQGLPKDPVRARSLLPEVAERGSVLGATALAQDIGDLLSGPEAAGLSEKQRHVLEVQFKRMVHLIAVFGGGQGQENYVRTMTRLTPLPQLAPKDAEQSIVVNDEVVTAMAWARIYREGGGTGEELLRWLSEAEAWIAGYNRVRERVTQRERSLRAELARVQPKAP